MLKLFYQLTKFPLVVWKYFVILNMFIKVLYYNNINPINIAIYINLLISAKY